MKTIDHSNSNSIIGAAYSSIFDTTKNKEKKMKNLFNVYNNGHDSKISKNVIDENGRCKHVETKKLKISDLDSFLKKEKTVEEIGKEYFKSNRKFYAWAGQNASTGTPHPTTGRMSMYGNDYVFDNKEDRDLFVDEYRSDNPSEYCIACSYKELRSRNLGCSVADWKQDLDYNRQMIKLDNGEFDYLF